MLRLYSKSPFSHPARLDTVAQGMEYVVVAAPAPQAPPSPKKLSGSTDALEGYACLTSANGRKYYMHSSGR